MEGLVVHLEDGGQVGGEGMGVAHGLGVDAGDHELPGRGVGQIGEGGEVSAEVAVGEGGVRSRPAGPFPLGLGGQREGAAGFGGEPFAEGDGLVPGDADDGLVGLVDVVAPVHLVLPAHVVDAAVVVRVEELVLGVGDFGLEHPEGLGDGHGGEGLLVGIAVGVAHDEAAGGDAHEAQLAAVAEIDDQIPLGALEVRGVLGGEEIGRASCRERV